MTVSSSGWTLRNDIIWHKTDPPAESVKTRWRSGHEHIRFLTKSRSGYRFNDSTIGEPYLPSTLARWGNGQRYGGRKSSSRTNEQDSRMRHDRSLTLNPNGCIPVDVWTLPAGNSHARHYATFPTDFVEPIVGACTNEGDLVFDPFGGTGTACFVAAKMNRRYLMEELNPEYAAIAKERLCVVREET